MKECPHCSAPLADTAIKCKHCRRRIDQPAGVFPIPQFGDLKYKTAGRRFGAAFIDGIIFFPIGLIELWIMTKQINILTAAIIVFFNAALVFYSVFMHASYGQTIGKMLFKIKVLDLSGKKLLLRQALIRDILPIVSFFIRSFFILSNPITYINIALAQLHHEHIVQPFWFRLLDLGMTIWTYLELATMLTNKKRRSLHDYMAHSIVVKEDV